MGIREYAIFFALIVLAIYVGNMWTHKELKRQEEYAAYLKSLQQPTQTPA